MNLVVWLGAAQAVYHLQDAGVDTRSGEIASLPSGRVHYSTLSACIRCSAIALHIRGCTSHTESYSQAWETRQIARSSHGLHPPEDDWRVLETLAAAKDTFTGISVERAEPP